MRITPAGMLICLLLDNHSAHRSRETRHFLASKPGRFELVFTPTHASWLNYVETFFSKARAIGAATHPGRQQGRNWLIAIRRRYIETCNAIPLFPIWRYGITPDTQAQAA